MSSLFEWKGVDEYFSWKSLTRNKFYKKCRYAFDYLRRKKEKEKCNLINRAMAIVLFDTLLV